jgi:hypothetical protein
MAEQVNAEIERLEDKRQQGAAAAAGERRREGAGMMQLFIGGENDGRRASVHGRMDTASLAVVTPPLSLRRADLALPPEPGVLERFVPIRLRGNTTEFVVFALEGMSVDEVLSRLIENYPEPRKR